MRVGADMRADWKVCLIRMSGNVVSVGDQYDFESYACARRLAWLAVVQGLRLPLRPAVPAIANSLARDLVTATTGSRADPSGDHGYRLGSALSMPSAWMQV